MNNLRGRPTKLTAEKIELAIKLREKGFTIEEIAQALHVTEQLLYLKNSEWEELRKQLNLIKEKQEIEKLNKVSQALYKRAVGQKVKTKKEVLNKNGEVVELTEVKEIPGDVKAQQFYLINRDPENWSINPADAELNNESADKTITIKIED